MYYDCCEKELRALGKSLECCVCIRLMESPARTRWYALATRLFLMPSLSLSLSLSENFEMRSVISDSIINTKNNAL